MQWGRAAINIVAGLSPVVVLTAAFLFVIEALALQRVAGVALTSILVACAVFTPLLSYVVSAPVFAGINALGATDAAVQCAVVRRCVPRLFPWTSLLGAGLGFGFGAMLGWPVVASAMLATNFALHLLMAVAMVAGFATRRPVMLVATWVSYAAALIVAPGSAWWLPALVATLVHVAWLVVLARKVGRQPLPSPRRMLASVPFGYAEGAPIWLLGPILWLRDPTGFLAGVYYPALVPSLIGYQVFMFTVSDQLWQGVARLHVSLAATPYGQAKDDYRALAARARGAKLGIVCGYGALAVLGCVLASFLGAAAPTVGIVVVSCVSGMLFAFCYLCSIVGLRGPLSVAAAVLTLLGAIAIAFPVSTTAYLVAVAVVGLGLTVWSASVALASWRRPEFTLFWRRAMSL